MNNSRERFEAWVMRFYKLDNPPKSFDGKYESSEVGSRWVTWQAAEQSCQAEIDALKVAFDNLLTVFKATIEERDNLLSENTTIKQRIADAEAHHRYEMSGCIARARIAEERADAAEQRIADADKQEPVRYEARLKGTVSWVTVNEDGYNYHNKSAISEARKLYDRPTILPDVAELQKKINELEDDVNRHRGNSEFQLIRVQQVEHKLSASEADVKMLGDVLQKIADMHIVEQFDMLEPALAAVRTRKDG